MSILKCIDSGFPQMLSTALPRSNSFNDEALARSYHPGKVILNSSCWIYQCNLGWLVCDWCPLMVLGSAGWILMALDDSLWDLISDKCWCLIHLILGLMKVLMTLLMFATHELPARSSTNAADAKAKASTPPSSSRQGPSLAILLGSAQRRHRQQGQQQGFHGSQSQIEGESFTESQSQGADFDRAQGTVKGAGRPGLAQISFGQSNGAQSESIRSALGWSWSGKPDFFGFDWRPHPEFGILVQDSVWVCLSISGGCGVPHSCSHLPTDNEFANHQRHSAPKSAGQMGDTTAGPASLLNAMAKAGNPCCACITAVYQSKLDMEDMADSQ